MQAGIRTDPPASGDTCRLPRHPGTRRCYSGAAVAVSGRGHRQLTEQAHQQEQAAANASEALRAPIRYRADLSTMALDALDTVDLTREALVSAEQRMVRDTTITMPLLLHGKLKKIADDRGSSMNIS